MRRGIDKRLADLEARENDWLKHASVIDYIDLVDYENSDAWTEIYHDDMFTAFRHAETGEVRAAYRDRRTDKEIVIKGGNLAFL